MFETMVLWYNSCKTYFSVLYKRYQFESTIVTESPQIYMQFRIKYNNLRNLCFNFKLHKTMFILNMKTGTFKKTAQNHKKYLDNRTWN